MFRQTRSKAKLGFEKKKETVIAATQKQKSLVKKTKRPIISDDSSSESDLENYLKPANEIDLRSSFFEIPKAEKQFSEIEKNILSDVGRLSGSDLSEDDAPNNEERAAAMEIQKLNVQQMQEHLQKLEEAKRHVEEYVAKKQSQKKKSRKKVKTEENIMNIADLLSVGEKLSKVDLPAQACSSLDSEDFTSMSESEREDWEEVKEGKEKSIVPKEGVQITVQMPGVIREKKGVDLVAAMKRRLNRIKKENQVFIHKVHLLCWIAHGNDVNRVINNEKFLGLTLSLIPSEQCYPADRIDLSYLEQILNWYRKTVQHLEQTDDSKYDLEKKLHIDISKKQASNKRILVLIFICILRALGIQCRLVMSLLALPLRPPNSELCSLSTKNVDKKKEKQPVNSDQSKMNKDEEDKQKQCKTTKEGMKKNDVVRKVKQCKTNEVSGSKKQKTEKDNCSKKQKSAIAKLETNVKISTEDVVNKKKVHFSESQQNAGASKTKPNLSKIKMSFKLKKSEDTLQAKPERSVRNKRIPQADGTNDSESEQTSSSKKPNLKRIKESKTIERKRRMKSLPDYTERDSEEEFMSRSPFVKKNNQNGTPKVNLSKLNSKTFCASKRSNSASPRKMDVRNDIINLIKGRMVEEKQNSKMKLVKPARKLKEDSEEDSDYYPEPIKQKKHDSDDEFIASLKPKVKRRVQVKQEDSEEQEHKRKGNDIWVEVYLEAEEKWISVDVIRRQLHCINEIYKRATHPVSYILAWDNKNYIKDITKRYCSNWNTVTRKLRVDSKYWEETLKPFTGPKTARDREEDEELAKLQLEKPLPTTIAEYKNHPLYALKRHLLKFEAIYPPDAVTLGFVRNEPVYSRDCVHTLHSREIWLKHAKVVRVGEKPYKIVKARPKYDRLSNTVITDKPLEIFGSWQVDDYVPPTAENGVVPRNEYGNVELFKACMLPKGTVHLQLPGLNKVAKKLNIDCAPAVVGFDFHSGWSHPMFDGFVVCEEYKDTLIAAWEQDQEEAERRAQEKIEKRVYDNWRRLIKGLLIRERLKAKYDFGEPSTSGSSKQKRKAKPVTLVVKKKR